MGSRRRRRKSDADAAFGIVVLLSVGVFLYPNVFYYILWTVVVTAGVIAAFFFFRRPDGTLPTRSRTIVISNASQTTNTESGTDLYGVWKSLGATNRDVGNHEGWSIELLRALEWKRFEIVCAKYFEMQGFTTRTNRCGADGGVDIHLFKNGSQHPDVAVQCKAWSTYKVGVKTARELLGVMTADRVKQGILITIGDYSNEARKFAEGRDITLVDGEDLLRSIEALTTEQRAQLLTVATDGDYTTPTCPSCGVKMTLRTNVRDDSRFWGCLNYPRCHSTFRYSETSS